MAPTYRYVTRQQACDYWRVSSEELDKLLAARILFANKDGLIVYTRIWGRLRGYLTKNNLRIIDLLYNNDTFLKNLSHDWEKVRIYYRFELYKLNQFMVLELLRSGFKIADIDKYMVYDNDLKLSFYFTSFFDAMEYIVLESIKRGYIINLSKGKKDNLRFNFSISGEGVESLLIALKLFIKKDWRRLRAYRENMGTLWLGYLTSVYLKFLYMWGKHTGLYKDRNDIVFGHNELLSKEEVHDLESKLDEVIYEKAKSEGQ
ncbi:MAG: hypothetical protein KatS3mg083_084 [Candidatus Dojkabacteria bacterium]|nr:MAG: hypothetical protein KatS3mg083_084 [Candidatus Dojkabacteria bacterium]